MIDKGKYASHGAFIKKISQNYLAKRQKSCLAVINPIPSTQPRQKPSNNQLKGMQVQSKTFNAKFQFQEPVDLKPVPSELIQPFLYIEKVLKPKKMKEKDDDQKKKKLMPFVTSKTTANVRKNNNLRIPVSSKPPEGYHNLFEYETDKMIIANKLFEKILQAEIENIKDIFNLWNKDASRKLGNDINIYQQEFIDFVKQLIPSKISTQHIRHFFDLYKNKEGQRIVKQENQIKPTISIRAFSFNYSKYKKSQTQITNIMSQKASKDRYKEIKLYVTQFLKIYPSLKNAMQGIKEYEETLRKHFKRIYDSYQNPFADQISNLKQELAKPIIKYDKIKKEQLQEKIHNYENLNTERYEKLTQDYNEFMNAYEDAIVKNHDLFFTKRTVLNLLKPIIEYYPYITRQLIEQQVNKRREEKQDYLQTLSGIVVEIDNDKKHVVEDMFTLGDIVQIIQHRKRKHRLSDAQISTMVASMKKLIKQIKRQFLIKNNLIIQDIDNFPADQQLPLEILHTCFEMQCTKVLFKNQIWNELLQMLPERSVVSRLHQLSIDSNTCMEYLKKYFRKLDQRSKIQLNKSKEISLVVENAYGDNFGQYAAVINKVCSRLDCFIDDEEEENLKDQQKKKKKKVAFADVIDAKMAVDRGESNIFEKDLEQQRNQQMAKNILKLIHQPENLKNSGVENRSIGKNQGSDAVSQLGSPIQNLSMLKTLARSYFEPQAMNTNAFDIRFYEKLKNDEKMKKQEQQQEYLELGQSLLLKGAPKLTQIQGQQSDPLRISRFLLKTIDHGVQQSHKIVKEKQYEKNIQQGVSNNYFREKIKLQNKPTRYDSQGKGKYSVILPVGYYESYIVGENVPNQQKWYLRPHHVETLTENPLSKKDNIINTEYQSKLQKLGAKKRPDEFVIEANVKRKEQLIEGLEQRIAALKREVVHARRQNQINNVAKVPTSMLNNYYEKITEGKEDKQLQLAAYQGVLYDLRRKQRNLLNSYRQNETNAVGQPEKKWWERKDKNFNHELKKDRQLLVDGLMQQGRHREYVEKLKNSQIY